MIRPALPPPDALRAAFPGRAAILDHAYRETRFCRKCGRPRDLHPLCAACGRVVCAIDAAGCCATCAEGRRLYLLRHAHQLRGGSVGMGKPAASSRAV